MALRDTAWKKIDELLDKYYAAEEVEATSKLLHGRTEAQALREKYGAHILPVPTVSLREAMTLMAEKRHAEESQKPAPEPTGTDNSLDFVAKPRLDLMGSLSMDAIQNPDDDIDTVKSKVAVWIAMAKPSSRDMKAGPHKDPTVADWPNLIGIPDPMLSPELKMVIVMRKDLNMRKGKMVAQGAHAATAFFLFSMNTHPHVIKDHESRQSAWLASGMKKICVGVDSEAALLDIEKSARAAGLEAHLILDAGRTEFSGPTYTCLAIGPNLTSEIDKITGHLKLL